MASDWYISSDPSQTKHTIKWTANCVHNVNVDIGNSLRIMYNISPESYEKIWKENILLLGIYSLE